MNDDLGDGLTLSENEMARAKAAWLTSQGQWKPIGGKPKSCKSSYPRKTLVSDFVAKKTGELFIFVNDAVPLLVDPINMSFHDSFDAHYRNNRGSAKITLMRVPLVPDFNAAAAK